MRTVFLALATSAAIFATGLTPAGAQNYPYCIQGDDFAGGAGECSFSSYAQCQATASGRTAHCEPAATFTPMPSSSSTRAARAVVRTKIARCA